MSRKAILLIDGSNECEKARKFLQKAGVDFVEYNVKDKDVLESGCCEGFTTEVPSLFAPEGVYKGFAEIKKYVKMQKGKKQVESESAYW